MANKYIPSQFLFLRVPKSGARLEIKEGLTKWLNQSWLNQSGKFYASLEASFIDENIFRLKRRLIDEN